MPLFPGRLLRNRNVALLLLQTWLVGMVYYGGSESPLVYPLRIVKAE